MKKLRLLGLLPILVGPAAPAPAELPGFLKIFRPAASVEADPTKSYELGEADGPWLILATYTKSRAQAERVALEIRQELGLAAYIYQEKFDFTGPVQGNHPASRRVRYANPYQYEAYAVLAGEYDSADHPGVEGDLKRIRTAKLPVFEAAADAEGQSSRATPIDLVKAFAAEIYSSQRIGPMGNAFLTRNPMLPQDYFYPPEVDSFVHQLNEDVPFSLLQCSGKYTVVVKTFEGQGAIVDGKQDKGFAPSGRRLAQNSALADKMTKALRDKGVEAYQFHDRYRSLVTVGSFDELGRELPGGEFEYHPAIERTMKEYGALNVDPGLARQVPGGTQGYAANAVAMIPFDVQPKPIAVPKKSKRSLYNAALGMR